MIKNTGSRIFLINRMSIFSLMKEKKYNIKWTNRIITEPAPDFLRLLEYIGTNEKGEAIKVFIHRIEKIKESKK